MSLTSGYKLQQITEKTMGKNKTGETVYPFLNGKDFELTAKGRGTTWLSGDMDSLPVKPKWPPYPRYPTHLKMDISRSRLLHDRFLNMERGSIRMKMIFSDKYKSSQRISFKKNRST